MKRNKEHSKLFRLGTSLWLERTKKNISQDKCARLANIKVSTLRQIESGKRMNNFGAICRVADVLEIKLSDLMKKCENFGDHVKLYETAHKRRSSKLCQ